MKLIILISISFTVLFNSSCVTIPNAVAEAERECHRLFNNVGISYKQDNDKWSKREYVHCVSNITNARTNQTTANASSGLVVTQWAVMGVTVIIGLMSQ